MPGWHAKTTSLVEAGKIKVLGITEEQHPDRTALFMQWQQMSWPVLLDSLNLLACKAIPFTLLIDEHGVVRFQNPGDDDLQTFLETRYQAPEAGTPQKNLNPERDSPEGLILWGGVDEIDQAVTQLEARVKAQPNDGTAHFRLGVAYRKRHDSPKRREGDFSKAIASWKHALDEVPSQYIWRRRIQQYGPRLDKPYSFYDWVHQAREEIVARGETPHSLVAEPSGAEFAYPEKQDAEETPEEHPDPEGKVPQDSAGLIGVETTAVPSTKNESPAYRVHLTFSPDAKRKVHWTNDAGRLSFFPKTSDDYSVENVIESPVPEALTSSETRHIELEIRPRDGKALPQSLEGAAYYYVCEDVNGQCLFLRRPITIPLVSP